jgi:hypothetical protein
VFDRDAASAAPQYDFGPLQISTMGRLYREFVHIAQFWIRRVGINWIWWVLYGRTVSEGMEITKNTLSRLRGA